METVQELTSELHEDEATGIQSCGWLLELSLDWIVLRASENIHHLLHESHVTLIDEPLGRYVHSQALHDLRNLFARLSGTTGIARAYGIRLTDEHELVDIAFQLSDGRVLLEAVPTARGFGECFGSVGGLVAGLSHDSGQALLDAGARRMRALTGYDRVTLVCADKRAESSRGGFERAAHLDEPLPPIIADTHAHSVFVFPREPEETSASAALFCTPSESAVEALRAAGIRSTVRIPFAGETVSGTFQCDSRSPREPCLELHAAAELFAQLFAMQLEIDRLKNG